MPRPKNLVHIGLYDGEIYIAPKMSKNQRMHDPEHWGYRLRSRSRIKYSRPLTNESAHSIIIADDINKYTETHYPPGLNHGTYTIAYLESHTPSNVKFTVVDDRNIPIYHNNQPLSQDALTVAHASFYVGFEYLINQGVDLIISPGSRGVAKDNKISSADILKFWQKNFYLLDALASRYPGFIIVAAGNDNSNNDRYPVWPGSMGWPNLLVVAAALNGNITDISNYGRSVHIAADSRQSPSYKIGEGTTSGAVWVLGAIVSNIKSRYPHLSNEEIKKLLVETGQKPGNQKQKYVSAIVDPVKLEQVLRERYDPDLLRDLIAFCNTASLADPQIYIPLAVMVGLFGEYLTYPAQYLLRKICGVPESEVIEMMTEMSLRSALPPLTSAVQIITKSSKDQSVKNWQDSRAKQNNVIISCAKAAQGYVAGAITTTMQLGFQHAADQITGSASNFVTGAVTGLWTSSSKSFIDRSKYAIASGAAKVWQSIPGVNFFQRNAQQADARWERYCRETATRFIKYLINKGKADVIEEEKRKLFKQWKQEGLNNSKIRKQDFLDIDYDDLDLDFEVPTNEVVNRCKNLNTI